MATSDSTVMSAAERDAYRPTATLLAVVAAALSIAAIGLYIGPLRFLRHGGVPWVDFLPATFGFWDTQPLSSHLFLAFQNTEQIAQGHAYTSYSPFWLLLLYAFLKPLHWLGIPYERSQVALCIPHLAVILLLLATHLRHFRSRGLIPFVTPEHFRLFVATLAVAGVVSAPTFWIPFFRFNPEQYFFLPALAFCHFAAADYRGTLDARTGFAVLLAIALLAPLFTPFATLSWLVLWELRSPPQSQRNRGRLRWLGMITAIGILVFLLPRAIVHLTAFTGTGSGFRFRSGLDGSQQYFSSMIQAVLAPSYAPGRPWHVFQWPFAALVAIGAGAAISREQAARMLRQLFICCVPVLWTVIVFPQWVSIHPYFFDFHFAFGSAFCLAFWMQQPELGGWMAAPAPRLAVLMAGAALLVTNLIDLARTAY